MKKILIVASDGLSKSGVPTTFMNIIRGLNESFVFDVLYFDKTDDFYKNEINSFGGKAIYCSIDTYKTTKLNKLFIKFRYKNVIKKVIAKNGPYQAVHSFKGFESGYILKAAKELGISNRIAHKTFMYRKSSNPLINIIERREIQLTVKYSRLLIADSLNSLKNPCDLTKKGLVIKTYVDENHFNYNDVKQTTAPISFIQIGSYCGNKNQIFSLEVFKNILKEYPNSKLHFVGFRNLDDYSYFDKLIEETKNSNLTSHVEFHDFNININELFKECHYLLFPSISESFGIVPVEAQIAGLSCFCSKNITSESNCGGNYYLPLDVNIWVQLILKNFLADKGIHKHFDCREFKKENVIRKYLEIYNT